MTRINIIISFKATGLYPLNALAIPETVFESSSVTELLVPVCNEIQNADAHTV